MDTIPEELTHYLANEVDLSTQDSRHIEYDFELLKMKPSLSEVQMFVSTFKNHSN